MTRFVGVNGELVEQPFAPEPTPELDAEAPPGRRTAPTFTPSALDTKSKPPGALISLVIGLVIALGIIFATGRPAQPTPAAQPTSAPVALAAVTPTVLATPAQPALPTGLAVYFGPDGDAAPSVPRATTQYTATARYGGWVQLAIVGYQQPVWARADALPGVNVATLPAPYQATPTPAPVVIRERVEVPVTILCTLDNATYRATRRNVQGSATAPSCTSQAEAEANAEALLVQQTGKGSTP